MDSNLHRTAILTARRCANSRESSANSQQQGLETLFRMDMIDDGHRELKWQQSLQRVHSEAVISHLQGVDRKLGVVLESIGDRHDGPSVEWMSSPFALRGRGARTESKQLECG
jgi:hypothetical protein